MPQIELIPDEGWILRVNKAFSMKCGYCRIKLKKDFYFCRETNKIYCKECEKEVIKKYCRYHDEHEHYHIIQVDKLVIERA